MSINLSSQIEQEQQSSNNATIVATTDSSVRNLNELWKRKQNYQQKLFKSSTNNHDQSNRNVAPWRLGLVHILESPQAHIIVIFLLLFDLAICVIELSSSFKPSSCKNVEEKLEPWYHWVGISILGLLFLKIVILGVGLGRSFFKKPGYVVDGVVVGVGLVLETVLNKVGGGLVVVASLWRVVRAVESVFELSDEVIQAKVEGVVSEFGMLREENKRLMDTIVEKEKVILKLQQQLIGE